MQTFIDATSLNSLDKIKVFNKSSQNQIVKRLANLEQHFFIPTSCVEFLELMSVAVTFYETIGYAITVQNMTKNIIHSIALTMENLNEKQAEVHSMKLTKLVHNNSLQQCLLKTMAKLNLYAGTRGIPLLYLILEDLNQSSNDLLIVGEAYSNKYGRIIKELVKRKTHYHLLYVEDNCMLFDKFYKSFCGTKVELSITSTIKMGK